MNHYRGKTVNTEEWIYGYLLGDRELNGIAQTYYILELDAESFDEIEEVAPESVGQFTGLEINDVKLYERQSFTYKDDIYTVLYNDKYMCWDGFNERTFEQYHMFDLDFNEITIMQD
jgi:hypothetical protein